MSKPRNPVHPSEILARHFLTDMIDFRSNDAAQEINVRSALRKFKRDFNPFRVLFAKPLVVESAPII